MPSRVIEIMSQGYPKEVLSAKLGVSIFAMWDWMNEDSPRFKPDFYKAVKEGESYLKAHWLEKAKGIMDTNEGNASIAIFGLKNIMGWRDRQELSGDPDRPLQAVISTKPMGLDEWEHEQQEEAPE